MLPFRFFPKSLRDRERVNIQVHPPCDFTARMVELAVMGAAERDRVFVTDLSAQGLRLSKFQVMGIRGRPAANQAWLCGDEPEVMGVTPARCSFNQKPRLCDVGRGGLALGRLVFCKIVPRHWRCKRLQYSWWFWLRGDVESTVGAKFL